MERPGVGERPSTPLIGQTQSPRAPASCDPVFITVQGGGGPSTGSPGRAATASCIAPPGAHLAPPPPAPSPLCGGSGGLTFDQALSQYIGEFGWGQIFNFVVASLFWMPNAMLILLLVFSVGSPVKDHDWVCIDPTDAACAAVLASHNPSDGFCSLGRSQWAWTKPRGTLTAQFDLVCSDAWKAQTANSFFFIGYLIGSGMFGQLSDHFGRKPCLFAAAIISAVLPAAGIACKSYWPWLVTRLLSGIGAAGTALGAYILATEAIGESWRGAAGIASQVFFIAGEFVLVAAAAAFPTWRGQAAACAVMNAAGLLLWPIVPESARWLLVQGRKQEALKIMERFAAWNRTSMPDRDIGCVSSNGESGGGSPRLTLSVALRDWHIARRSLVLAYSWMVICMTYYGISFALSSLGGSLRVSFMVSSIAELPSYIFAGWAIDRWGRHNTMGGSMLLGGAACTICAFVPPGGAQMALASIGKFGIAGAFAIASIYTSELFPTLIRSAVLGAVNQAARVGGIIAPFVAMAGNAHGSSLAPFLTFGIASLVGGLLIFTLPETLGVPLPDTMDDMDNIASIFTHKTFARQGLKAAAASMFKSHVKLPAPPGGGGAAGGSKAEKAAAARAWMKAKKGQAGQQGRSVWAEDEVLVTAGYDEDLDDPEGALALIAGVATPASARSAQRGGGGGGGSLQPGGGGAAAGGAAAGAPAAGTAVAARAVLAAAVQVAPGQRSAPGASGKGPAPSM